MDCGSTGVDRSVDCGSTVDGILDCGSTGVDTERGLW